MSLEISGKLITLLPVETGQGKNGQWTKQPFIIETEEQYPKKVCVSAWNDNAKTIQGIKPFSTIKVAISIESREYNGRWYTDLRSWKVEVIGQSGEMDKPGNNFAAPSAAVPAESLQAEGQEDDLPF
jgi:Domain of unknown function (DUF3127)